MPSHHDIKLHTSNFLLPLICYSSICKATICFPYNLEMSRVTKNLKQGPPSFFKCFRFYLPPTSLSNFSSLQLHYHLFSSGSRWIHTVQRKKPIFLILTIKAPFPSDCGPSLEPHPSILLYPALYTSTRVPQFSTLFWAFTTFHNIHSLVFKRQLLTHSTGPISSITLVKPSKSQQLTTTECFLWSK